MLKNMFKKTYTLLDTKYKKSDEPSVPQGLWRRCNKCGQPIYVDDVKANYYICPKCHGYFRVHAYRRIEMVVDEGTFEEWNKEMPFENPLNFPGYEKKVNAAREKTKLNEAVVTGKGKINGNDAVVAVCDARFIMSSMGHVVGEKITQAVERATAEKLPVIIFACSGGARMQEGIVSLMQMAKTAAALKKHHEAGQLFISVLTDPTTGGVTASFAMLGDIILAEPNALIGFAGPRVIEQTIGQKLPEGFQRAEFLLEHGFVDKIVGREELKDTLAQILVMHKKPENAAARLAPEGPAPESFHKRLSGRDPWETVQLSRNADRPTALDYINILFDDFMEFHGDRYFKDDGAIVGGIATFKGVPVTVIGQQKGKNTKENLKRNFGMPSPDGYRKALRLMKQAETFGRPVICFVDTPGAFCGIEAEERGQGEAIARNLFEMSDLKVPVVSIVIGEGGSGGALAILWKDSKKAPEASRVMKVTAKDLYEMKIIERVIVEKEPASSKNIAVIADEMRRGLEEFLSSHVTMTGEELAAERYERFRRM